MKINNCKELWCEWMGDHIEDSKVSETFSQQLLRKWVFKGTECGCVFDSDEKGVIVGGYAEGSDAELPMHNLDWGFTIEEFTEALDYADKEGCIAWHEANDEDLATVMITEEEWLEENNKTNPGSN
jgi:hypothetical protein